MQSGVLHQNYLLYAYNGLCYDNYNEKDFFAGEEIFFLSGNKKMFLAAFGNLGVEGGGKSWGGKNKELWGCCLGEKRG